MKTIFLAMAVALLIMSSALSQDLDYAKRILKLANTKIWLEKYDEASELVEEAKGILNKYTNWEAKYWDAVADETLGHIFFQLGNYDFAENYFNEANNKYSKLISSNFKGSQVESKELINRAKETRKMPSEGNMKKSGKLINLSYSTLTGYLSLPDDLVGFVAVESNINKFPSELYGKKYLKSIVLKGNRLNEVIIKDLPSLEYLDLSDNNISTIQIESSSTANLKYLNLSNNRLKKIPAEILSLKKLELIDLSNNNIPFSEISNLLQNMPNTLIIFDSYELIEEEE